MVVSKDRLFLRGNFTGAHESRKDCRTPQGLPTHKGQILEAESLAFTMAAMITTNGVIPDHLPWEAP